MMGNIPGNNNDEKVKTCCPTCKGFTIHLITFFCKIYHMLSYTQGRSPKANDYWIGSGPISEFLIYFFLFLSCLFVSLSFVHLFFVTFLNMVQSQSLKHEYALTPMNAHTHILPLSAPLRRLSRHNILRFTKSL